MNKIPFLDLAALHVELEDELVRVFLQALRSGTFVGGPMVEGFERDFARYCGSTHCVGVGSGTDALRFALMASGVRNGDIVLTVPNSFIATTEAITQAGALPRFVDIDGGTHNMDTEKLREFLLGCVVGKSGRPVDPKTGRPVAAVVPVHIYGQPADMDRVFTVAREFGLIVVEDACQAHGAEYFSERLGRWLKAGTMGLASAVSFYPGKNLGACGEAGAVLTNDGDMARKVRMLRDHGQRRKYVHEMEGYNGRLDAIQAGILSAKLKHLDGWNESRRGVARRYGELLSRVNGIVTPREPAWSKSVYHLYVIRTGRRDELQRHLAGANILTGLHYPGPLHLQRAYRGLGYGKGDFPVTEEDAREILSLPIYPGLSEERVSRIVDEIRVFFAVETGLKWH